MTINQYPFDIITMSETWLKDNKYRDWIRGSRVGIYIRESINFKCPKDIENLNPDMEHLWLEIPEHNKNSKLLLRVTYHSERIMQIQD